MLWHSRIVILALGWPLTVSAKSSCPVPGPLFPAPKNLRDHPRTKVLAANVVTALKEQIKPGGLNYSYVVQGYTTGDGVVMQETYTAPKLRDSNTTGVREVDENTVIRVGSITKLFNVLAFKARIGENYWNDPITKYIPELQALGKNSSGRSPVYYVDWDEITVGSLASFYSGLMRDCKSIHQIVGEIMRKGWTLI
jgi:CubicO group peptidase (beta-lactamase class C family)